VFSQIAEQQQLSVQAIAQELLDQYQNHSTWQLRLDRYQKLKAHAEVARCL
jgi:hypothetical protein